MCMCKNKKVHVFVHVHDILNPSLPNVSFPDQVTHSLPYVPLNTLTVS